MRVLDAARTLLHARRLWLQALTLRAHRQAAAARSRRWHLQSGWAPCTFQTTPGLPSCPPPKVIWEGRVTCINYTLMVVGFGLYLLVGFNSAMGRPTLMRQVRKGLRAPAAAGGQPVGVTLGSLAAG